MLPRHVDRRSPPLLPRNRALSINYTNAWEGGLNCEAKAQDLEVTLFPRSRGVTAGQCGTCTCVCSLLRARSLLNCGDS